MPLQSGAGPCHITGMAEIKTRPTDMSVDTFLDGVGNLVRRADGKAVRAMMERVSKARYLNKLADADPAVLEEIARRT